MNLLVLLPSGLLEVADEHGLLARKARPQQQALGVPQRRTVARAVGRDLGFVEGQLELAAVRGGAHAFLDVAAEQDERAAILGAERADDLARRVPGFVPVVAVA